MISVCIPVFNGARYIGETLESLSLQSYRDFEVIVSDNASTDGTADVVARWKDRLPRLRYSRNERNLGYCANVAKAVDLAASEIIAIYHSDDIYKPEILEREVRVLEGDPRLGGVFTRTTYYRGSESRDEDAVLPHDLPKYVPYNPEKKVFIGGLEEYGPALLCFGDFFACPSFMTRKGIFQKSGGFTDDYPTSEDLHLWIRLMDSGFSLAIIDEPFVRYRISETQGSAELRRHQDQSISFSVMDKFLINRSFAEEQVRTMYGERKAKDLLSAALNSFRLGDYKAAMDRVRDSRSISLIRGYDKFSMAQRFPRIGLPTACLRARLLDCVRSIRRA